MCQPGETQEDAREHGPAHRGRSPAGSDGDGGRQQRKEESRSAGQAAPGDEPAIGARHERKRERRRDRGRGRKEARAQPGECYEHEHGDHHGHPGQHVERLSAGRGAKGRRQPEGERRVHERDAELVVARRGRKTESRGSDVVHDGQDEPAIAHDAAGAHDRRHADQRRR